MSTGKKECLSCGNNKANSKGIGFIYIPDHFNIEKENHFYKYLSFISFSG